MGSIQLSHPGRTLSGRLGVRVLQCPVLVTEPSPEGRESEMAKNRHESPVYLPKSKVIVCLKTGETLTDDEVTWLDEYFLEVEKMHDSGGK